MFIRWMGAFGKGGSFEASLRWEVSPALREKACEFVPKGETSNLTWKCGVGLLFNKTSITRKFKGDVWSTDKYNYDPNGRVVDARYKQGEPDVDSLYLVPTRRPAAGHTEAFIGIGETPTGIVLAARHIKSMTRSGVLKTIEQVSKDFQIPVYVLNGKSLKPYYGGK